MRADHPTIDPDSAPWWEACERGELLVRRCGACGEAHLHPRRRCPTCWSDDVRWEAASGRGRLHTWSVVHAGALPPFADRLPYVAAIVELEEGPRLATSDPPERPPPAEEPAMTVTDLIGRPLPPQTVVVERGPVGFLARAVTDTSPVFQDARAAQEAGFEAVPAPPTYPFVMAHQRAWPELQPEGATTDHPLREVIGTLMADGGMILHGGQAFAYHRPVLVGDRLAASGRIADVTVKDRGEGKRMTFVVAETDWVDADGRPVVTSSMTLIHRT